MKNRKHGWLLALLALALCFLGWRNVCDANAASSAQIRDQLAELEQQGDAIAQELEKLEQQIGENRQELAQIVEQKYNIDRQIALLYEQTENINSQISVYSLLIADKQEELDTARLRLEELTAKNKARIRTMEEQGSINYWSVLFKANSFSDLLDRMAMIDEIQNGDRKMLAQLSAAADEVAQLQGELLQEKALLEVARSELEAAKSAMDEKRLEADELMRTLVERGEEYELFVLEAEAEQERLMQEIADKEAELARAEYLEWLATYVPPTTEATKPAPPVTGGTATEPTQPPVDSGIRWVSPVASYYLSSPFGMRLHPVHKVWKMHNGVDMACDMGTPIYASRSGKVTTAASHWSMGEYVSINHGDGYSSIYMHMTYFVVSAGQYVTAGQVIGYVGDSGVTSGPHLHFGIAYKGEYVNPMEYLD